MAKQLPPNPILYHRQRIGLTQRELAAKTGQSAVSICHWEQGKRAPSLHALPALAEALGCPIEELLPISDTPEPGRLTLARIRQHLTAQQVADQIGVARSTVIRWEQGYLNPGSENRAAYAQAIGINPETLPEPSQPGRPVEPQGPRPGLTPTDRTRARMAAQLTQAQLAALAGVSPSTIHRWEQGKPMTERTSTLIERSLKATTTRTLNTNMVQG